MGPLRLLLRLGGWLLTPFLALAASFFGATVGTLIAGAIADPFWGIGVTAATGGVAGFVAIVLWLRLLRRSPEIREALHVQPDGTPDALVAREPKAETPETRGALR